MGLREKKTFGYRERDDAVRATFLAAFDTYSTEQVVYVDEAGMDDTDVYPYGWCDRSERFHALKLGHRTERVSMVAGWCNKTILAPLTFKGYCNTALIEGWVEHGLDPELVPGQVVVFDNASFHKSDTIRDLIEQAGCRVVFLPPYSPDLNKIEKFWARIQHYVRKTLHLFDTLWNALDNAFRALS